MRNVITPMVLVAGLMACTAGQPQQTIAALESGLTVAERAAIGYVSLPRCPQSAPVCSDPAIVSKIKDADNTAYLTVKNAQAALASGGSPNIAAATAALSAFQSLLTDPAVAALIKGQ